MLYLVLENGKYAKKHHGLTLIEHLVLCKRKLSYPIWTQVRLLQVIKFILCFKTIRNTTYRTAKLPKILFKIIQFLLQYQNLVRTEENPPLFRRISIFSPSPRNTLAFLLGSTLEM